MNSAASFTGNSSERASMFTAANRWVISIAAAHPASSASSSNTTRLTRQSTRCATISSVKPVTP
jgi:hypothetical protein